MFAGAAADDERLDALLLQVTSRKFACLACANDQHRLVGEVVERALGDINCDRGNADVAFRDHRLAAHALAALHCLTEQARKNHVHAPGVAGLFECGAHLADDLLFAQNHRIKRRDDDK